MDVPVTIVANSLIDDVWYQIAPLLLKGEKYWSDYYAINDIKEACRGGTLQLWVGVRGREITVVALTTILVYPRNKYLCFIYCGGRRWHSVSHSHADVVKYAKEHGCAGIDIIARSGWERLLAIFGYKKRAVYLTLRFEEN